MGKAKDRAKARKALKRLEGKKPNYLAIFLAVIVGLSLFGAALLEMPRPRRTVADVQDTDDMADDTTAAVTSTVNGIRHSPERR